MAAQHALWGALVVIMLLTAHNALAIPTAMLPASATLVLQQLKIVILALSGVMLSGAFLAFKGKDL